jgi:hypothetical protein
VVISPAGLGPKNACAGEGQQQLYTMDERMLHKDYNRKCSVKKKILVVGLKGLGAKMN